MLEVVVAVALAIVVGMAAAIALRTIVIDVSRPEDRKRLERLGEAVLPGSSQWPTDELLAVVCAAAAWHATRHPRAFLAALLGRRDRD